MWYTFDWLCIICWICSSVKVEIKTYIYIFTVKFAIIKLASTLKLALKVNSIEKWTKLHRLVEQYIYVNFIICVYMTRLPLKGPCRAQSSQISASYDICLARYRISNCLITSHWSKWPKTFCGQCMYKYGMYGLCVHICLFLVPSVVDNHLLQWPTGYLNTLLGCLHPWLFLLNHTFRLSETR